jgi:glycosyltransferase involved in cell wall biosynthesis
MPVAAVIVPAHNEASIIDECLSTMLEGALHGEFDVIVATNGCTDDTAVVARRFSGVRIVDTPIASKTAALNLADRATDVWPRIYVDADVRVDVHALRETAHAITNEDALAAAPRFEVDTRGRPWTVRAYYDIYQRIPWTQEGMIGSGLYALSREGHDRLGEFPDVIYEDLVVSRLFRPGERVTVTNASFTISAPRDLRTLIAVKTRVATGNLAYRRNPPVELEQHVPARAKRTYLDIVAQPRNWLALAVYATVYVLTRIGARRRYRKGNLRTWTRDNTIRVAPPA